MYIFLSNRCNMQCGYCSVDLNHSPIAVLNNAQLLQALDWLMGQDTASMEKDITFFGGEPLLHFDVLRRFIGHARRRYASRDLRISVSTNGTLLTSKRISFFYEHHVGVYVSLDGAGNSNGGYRVFIDRSKGSVFDAVLANMRHVKGGVSASMVVNPDTAKYFSKNAQALHHVGFDSIGMGANMFREWTVDDWRALQNSFVDFKLYAARNKLKWSFLNGPVRAHGLRAEDLVPVLGADGYFYASAAALTTAYGKNKHLRVGSPQEGLRYEDLTDILIRPLEAQRRALSRTSDPGIVPAEELAVEFPELIRNVPGALCAGHEILADRRENKLERIRRVLEVSSLIYRTAKTTLAGRHAD